MSTLGPGWSDPLLPEHDPDEIEPASRRAARGDGTAAQKRRALVSFDAYLAGLSPSGALSGDAPPADPLTPPPGGKRHPAPHVDRALREIGGRIRSVRINQADWSQAQLAEAAGISRTTISEIETGQVVPSVATLLRIERAFDEATGMTAGIGALWRNLPRG